MCIRSFIRTCLIRKVSNGEIGDISCSSRSTRVPLLLLLYYRNPLSLTHQALDFFYFPTFKNWHGNLIWLSISRRNVWYFLMHDFRTKKKGLAILSKIASQLFWCWGVQFDSALQASGNKSFLAVCRSCPNPQSHGKKLRTRKKQRSSSTIRERLQCYVISVLKRIHLPIHPSRGPSISAPPLSAFSLTLRNLLVTFVWRLVCCCCC